MSKIYTVADIPPELGQAWLQHLRDFDTAHPGCHFEVMAEGPDRSVREMVEMLRVNPKLTVTEVWTREGQHNVFVQPKDDNPYGPGDPAETEGT